VDDARFQCQVQRNFHHVTRRQPVGLGLDLARLLVEQERAIAVKDLEAIPLRWVVAGSESQAISCALDSRGVGDEGRGRVLGEQQRGDVVASKDFSGCLGGPIGEEATVEPDDDTALFPALAGDLVGQRLGQPPDVVQRKALTDDRSPATGAKGDQVLFLVTAGTIEPLLQDELGLGQVVASVDAQYLVLVIDLVTLHPQTGADEVVGAVGEPVFAIQRGRGQRLQSGQDGLGADDISAHVQFADLAYLWRSLGLLNDVHDPAGGIADDAPVGKRAIYDGGEQCQVGLPQAVAVEQPPDGGRTEERGVAIEDEQVTVEILEQRINLQDGVTGAQLLLLDDIVVVRPQVCLYLLPPVAHDDIEVIWRRELQPVPDDVINDFAVAQRLEHHRCSAVSHGLFPGRQDDGL